MSESTIIEGVEYGPLAALVGVWKGDKGVDRAPEPDGEEKNLYYETILFETIGDVTNAESQTLSVLRYHQVVSRKSNDKVFHNETGYWMWDPQSNVIMQSFSIPRGVAVLAGGHAEPLTYGEEHIFEVSAAVGDPDWGILQSPFMRDNAKTLSFTHKISVEGEMMKYSQTMLLDIYDKQYEHKDINRLRRSQ